MVLGNDRRPTMSCRYCLFSERGTLKASDFDNESTRSEIFNFHAFVGQRPQPPPPMPPAEKIAEAKKLSELEPTLQFCANCANPIFFSASYLGQKILTHLIIECPECTTDMFPHEPKCSKCSWTRVIWTPYHNHGFNSSVKMVRCCSNGPLSERARVDSVQDTLKFVSTSPKMIHLLVNRGSSVLLFDCDITYPFASYYLFKPANYLNWDATADLAFKLAKRGKVHVFSVKLTAAQVEYIYKDCKIEPLGPIVDAMCCVETILLVWPGDAYSVQNEEKFQKLARPRDGTQTLHRPDTLDQAENDLAMFFGSGLAAPKRLINWDEIKKVCDAALQNKAAIEAVVAPTQLNEQLQAACIDDPNACAQS